MEVSQGDAEAEDDAACQIEEVCISYFHPTSTDWTPASDSDDMEDDPDYVPPAPTRRRHVALGRLSVPGAKVIDYVRIISESDEAPIDLVTSDSEDDRDSEKGGSSSERGEGDSGSEGKGQSGMSEEWENYTD